MYIPNASVINVLDADVDLISDHILRSTSHVITHADSVGQRG